MRDKIIWSIGLYSIDIIIYNVKNDYVVKANDYPIFFKSGVMSQYIKKNYNYDSRMVEGNVFRIYTGIDCRDINFTKELMIDISSSYNFPQQEVQNIEYLTSGLKTLIKLTKEIHTERNKF